MYSSVIDSEIFRDQYGNDNMNKVFSDENLVQCWANTWKALAAAEAEAGIIPEAAAEGIAAKAQAANFDFKEIRYGITKTAHPLMTQIRMFEKICGKEAGAYVHWGATTQDIMDTASVLQLKQAWAILEAQTENLRDKCLILAQKHRDTIMAGRTHGQHALPTTFGYKIAGWAEEYSRHLERIKEGKKRFLCLCLYGAAGTLASLGEAGLEVQQRMCSKLGLLNVPTTSWHTARDGFAECSSLIAMLAGTTGKIAQEIINLQRSELGEVEEDFSMDRIGSSTMPQKRNPMICENMVANVRIVLSHAALGFQGMLQEHERDMSYWQTEWLYLPQMCILTSNVMFMLDYVLEHMKVYPKKMERNLALGKGTIVAERVMLILGRYLGRNTAHDVLHEATMKAFAADKMLADILLEDERVTSKMTKEEILEALNPANYTGCAGVFVDKLVEKLTQ